MIKKTIRIVLVMILFNSVSSAYAFTNSGSVFSQSSIFTNLGSARNFTLFQTTTISTKSGDKYDESKDPALRKGTENWEETQGSFFVVPALVIGIIVLALFFSREK